MRAVVFILVVVSALSVHAQDMTGKQKEVWAVLVEQVGLDVKQDWNAMKKFMHPKGCFWGDMAPMPDDNSDGSLMYYAKLRAGEDKIVSHRLVPVSVIVVDDVAIINAYAHALTVDEEDEQKEVIYRLHNTWKKHEGNWKLLATYNTKVKSEDD